MKVLFLDIDGVLNSHMWAEEGGGFGCAPHNRPASRNLLKWDPAAVKNLRDITDATGAKIVISSSWRGYGNQAVRTWQDMFSCYDWPQAPVIDETPDLNRMENGIYVSRIRGDEVAAWLEANGPVESYVCLDDDADFRPEQPLVRTDMRYGLTSVEVADCIKRLTDSARGGE